jgi:hypothetical protein
MSLLLAPVRRVAAAVLAGAALTIAACADPSATAPDALALDAANSRAGGRANAGENRDLATLRQSLARFHSFEYASTDGGYDVLFDGKCFEQPGAGAMGTHYVKLGLVDETVELERPEALLYEPGPGGNMVLVGVEYVVDPRAWNAQYQDEAVIPIPSLFGREYTYNPVYDLYTLHVWTHKNNPIDTFEGWNPNVSCQYWNSATSGAHH